MLSNDIKETEVKHREDDADTSLQTHEPCRTHICDVARAREKCASVRVRCGVLSASRKKAQQFNSVTHKKKRRTGKDVDNFRLGVRNCACSFAAFVLKRVVLW